MTEHPRIRILIVDDHALVRKGITLFLSAYEDLQLVAEGANGKDAVHLCEQHQPHVILMDLMMPVVDGINGVIAISHIRDRYPAVQVIALTSFGKEELIKAAIKAGAIGYLLKNVAADELAAAIHAAVNKQPTLAKEATQVLMKSMSIPDDDQPALTDSERRVLKLMVDGYNNAHIAEALMVSVSTVKTHASNLFAKLGVTSRLEAVSLAVKRELVD